MAAFCAAAAERMRNVLVSEEKGLVGASSPSSPFGTARFPPFPMGEGTRRHSRQGARTGGGPCQMFHRRNAATTASGFSHGTKCPASIFSTVSFGT